MAGLTHGDCDTAIRSWEQIKRIKCHSPLQSCGIRLSGETVLRHGTFLKSHHGVIHSHIEKLTPVIALSAMNGGYHPKRHQRARENIRNGRRYQSVVGMHQAAKALGSCVKAGPVRVGTLTGTRITKATHTGIDDFRIPRGDHFVAQSQPIHHTSSQIFQHRVGPIAKL